MPVDLKCPNRSRHAVLYPEEGFIEVKCDRKFCGAGKDRVILHRFDLGTGELIQTLRFAEPMRKAEDESKAALRA